MYPQTPPKLLGQQEIPRHFWHPWESRGTINLEMSKRWNFVVAVTGLLGKFHDQMPQFFHFPNTNKTRHISIKKPQRNPTQCFAAISMLIYVDTIYRHVSSLSLCDTFWFFRYQHENAMQEQGNVGTNFLLPHPWRHSQCQIHQRSMITQADDHQLSTQNISSTVEPSHLNMLEQK